MTDDRPVTPKPSCEELSDRMRRALTNEDYEAAKAEYLDAGYGEEAPEFPAFPETIAQENQPPAQQNPAPANPVPAPVQPVTSPASSPCEVPPEEPKA